jgi:hypothetical protein
MDVVEVCEQSASEAPSQLLSSVLALVFAVYIFLDSAIAASVISRKARETAA